MYPKSENIESNNRLSGFSKALGHPVRIEILVAIAERGGKVSGEIIEIKSLAPSTVVQHLRELKKAGLIDGRIFGPSSSYGINWRNLNEFIEMFSDFAAVLSKKN